MCTETTAIDIIHFNTSTQLKEAYGDGSNTPRVLPVTCKKTGKPKNWTVYHKDIFMPAASRTLSPNIKKFVYRDSNAHLQDRSRQRSIPISSLPKTPSDLPLGYYVYESQYLGVKLYKQGIRFKYNAEYDVVIIVRTGSNEVDTAWLNHVSDTHSTLRKECYHTESDFVKLIFS